MLLVDYVSKRIETIATLTCDTKVVLKFLIKNMFSRFKTSRAIISNEVQIFVTSCLIHFLVWSEG